MDYATVAISMPAPTLAPPRAVVSPNPSTTRWVQLDALRVFAMAAIFAHHFADVRLGAAGPVLGELGVAIFLALSGFLITTTLLRDRQAAEACGQPWLTTLRYFYVRRSLRVFPLYYLILAVGLLFNIQPIRHVAWWFVTYTSNIYLSLVGNWDATGHFSHLWTLAVQEQFYLFWAPLVLTVPLAWLWPLTIGMTMLGPSYRLYGVLAHFNSVTLRCFTFSSFDALGLGALLAMALQSSWWRTKGRWIRAALLLLGVVMVWILLSYVETLPKAKIVTMNLGLAAMACWLISGAVRGFPGFIGRLFESRSLTYVGQISYGLYVYHLFMPMVVGPIARRLGLDFWYGGLMSFALSTAAAFVVASLSWRFLESPISSFKARFRSPV